MTQLSPTAPTGSMGTRFLRAQLASLLRDLHARWRALQERRQVARRERRALAELRSMDDRALADFGLRRSDIPWIRYRSNATRSDAPRWPLV